MRRRGLTLLELMVAVTLSSFMVFVVTLFVQETLRGHEQIMEGIETRRRLHPGLKLIRGDVQRAVAIAELPRFFSATRYDQALSDGTATRIDLLELVVVAPTPVLHLRRVNYSVAWDPNEDYGYLWRQSVPVFAAELPVTLQHLAASNTTSAAGSFVTGAVTAPAPDQLLIAGGVTRFRVGVADLLGPGTVDPPTAAGPPITPSLIRENYAAWVHHNELSMPPEDVDLFAPGSVIFLRHEPPPGQNIRFPEGHRLIEWHTVDRAFLHEKVAWATNVYYQGAFLPAHVTLDIRALGMRESLTIPLGGQSGPLLEEALRIQVQRSRQ